MCRFKPLIISALGLALFLMPFNGLKIDPIPKAQAVPNDSAVCSIRASYTVSNGNIVITWTADLGTIPYEVWLDDSIAVPQGLKKMSGNSYSRPVPNPDRNISFMLNVWIRGDEYNYNNCSTQFDYLKGSTSGGDNGAVIPNPITQDKCKEPPVMLITTYQNTSEVPGGNVGIKLVWNESDAAYVAKAEFEDIGTIYQDGKAISGIGKPYDALTGGDPKGNDATAGKWYFKLNFPHTESHSWYVSQKIKGCDQPVKSNTVKYNGSSGKVDQGGADAAAPGAIGGQPTDYTDPNAGTDQCTDKCTVGWGPTKLLPGNAIHNAICSMQCALIDWEAEILSYMVKCVLMPSTGLGYDACKPTTSST